MHRFAWDLHYEPIGEEPRAGSGQGAVPGHTPPPASTPWAPPGEYTVRLGVNGRALTRPLSLRLDPRVTTSAAALDRVARLSREMYVGAVASHAAYEEARELLASLKARGDAALAEEVEALAPEPRGGGFRFFRAAPAGPPTLDGVSDAMLRAAGAMQEADVAPTARQVAACEDARREYGEVMERWEALKARIGGA